MKLKQQNKTNIDYNDHFHRQRLRALQAVDELVDGLFDRLREYDVLDNTYIIYSSDNGFHIGQHRLQPGKSCGYEEDVHIPLLVRGPGVSANFATDIVTTHTDLAPTFFDLLGIEQREDFDGTAIPVTETGIEKARQKQREHVNVEYWGFAGGEGKYDRNVDSFFSNAQTLRWEQESCTRTILTRRYDSLDWVTISITRSGATTSTSYTT